VEIRALRAEDDLDTQLDLSERAFGVKSAGERVTWRQWWHGRAPDAPDAPAVRRAEPGDAQAVNDVLARVYEAHRDSGPLTWEPAMTAANLAREGFYHYLCDDGFAGPSRWAPAGSRPCTAGLRSPRCARSAWPAAGPVPTPTPLSRRRSPPCRF